MRGSLFICLISTFFSPLWSQLLKPNSLNSFFVSRRDNKEAVCISPAFSFNVFPTFTLDKIKTPQFVGFKFWDNWFDGWKLQNQTNVPGTGFARKLIAGDQPFHFVGRVINDDDYQHTLLILLLASNISIWITPDGNRSGMLLQLDHWNFTTNVKDTTLKYCDQNPEVEEATCTIEDFKIGTNYLDGGNRWTPLQIRLKENRTEIEMSEISYGELVEQWTWNNTNISDPLTSQNESSAVFVKSHQRNAALWYPDFSKPDLAYKKITKKYSKKKRGKLCVLVRWVERSTDDSNELMQVKNLASGRVQPATNIKYDGYNTYFQWDHLDAGEYKITLRLDQRLPFYIDLCPDSVVTKTWMSVPKAITNCLFIKDQFYTWPSSTPDPTLKTNWSLDDWEYVCDRLGIGSNDAEVQIKFCNRKGCNFSKCPHLQLEPSHLFDFAAETMTPVNSIKDNERPNFFSSLWSSIRTAIF